MAIIQYHDHDVASSLSETLQELSEHAQSTRAFLSMLGDYWTDYFKDVSTFAQAHTGSIVGAGRQLTRLYELLLSSNIIDFPVEQGPEFDLLVFDRDDFETVYNEDGSIDSFFVSAEGCDIQNFEYLTTSLFESAIILVNGEHFRCADGGVYFYVDIFEDPSICPYEYSLGDDSIHKVLLWASPIVVSHHYMWERFGRFIYRKSIDSYKYKWLLTGLMRYYTGPKSCANIQKVMDILFGIPYCRAEEETILSLEYTDADLNDWTNPRTDEASYIRITTDKRVYYTYAMAVMDYGVGDTVERNQMFGHFCRVMDYINTPYWWENEAWYFPDGSFAGEGTEQLTREEKNEVMDRLLKYNTVYFNLNIAYESWDLYCQIVDELYGIIKRGFPVYLNPYIEVIFRTAFSDDTDFWEKVKDCLWPIVMKLVISDEFCPFMRHDGARKFDGRWHYGLWNHKNRRMLDYITLDMHVEMGDEVIFCPYYDGNFDYDGEIMHTCYPDRFAWDHYTLDVVLEPDGFMDEVESDDEGPDLHGDMTMFDPFSPEWMYNAARKYDGSMQHYLWGRTEDARLTDRLGLHATIPDFFDAVMGCPCYDSLTHYDATRTFDGETKYWPFGHDYSGKIEHHPNRWFAHDLFGFMMEARIELWDYALGCPCYDGSWDHDDEIDHNPDFFTNDTLELSGEIAFSDRLSGLSPYNGSRRHDGGSHYTITGVADSQEISASISISDSLEEMRSPARYNTLVRYVGTAKYDGSSTPLAYDNLVIDRGYNWGDDLMEIRDPVLHNTIASYCGGPQYNSKGSNLAYDSFELTIYKNGVPVT